MEDVKKLRKKRNCWAEHEEVKLLAIWEEHIVDLRKAKRNSHVYAEMAQKMQMQNVNVGATEVHYKIANLTAKYRYVIIFMLLLCISFFM